MEQSKRAKVVMLPTNEKTKHLMVYSDVEKTKGKLILNGLKNDEYKEYQHLYIISNDKIKEDDWCIDSDRNIFQHKNHFPISIGQRKIIATTNPLLKIEIDGNRGDLLPDVSFDINLPQPSQQFIEKYIEEYNKGNVITDILVEYASDFNSCFCTKDICNGNNCPKKLKINPKDNTLTIKKLKETYNKEELYQILEKYTSFIWNEVGIHYPISLGIDAKDKFINCEL